MSSVKQTRIQGVDVFRICSGQGMSASVAPSLGACCCSIVVRVKGQPVELLHGANDFSDMPMNGRIPVLFPACGRLFADGAANRYRHRGVVYAMDRHGFAKDRAWRFVAAGDEEGKAWLICELESDARTREAYPYDFLARLRFEVHGARLSIVFEAQNRSSRPMPFSFGLHPYFRAPLAAAGSSRGQCVARIPGRLYWEMRDGAPTGRCLELPPELDFCAGVALPEEHLERVVAGLAPAAGGGKARAELIDTGAGIGVVTEFDIAQLDTVTVYAPAGSPYACLEARAGIPMDLSDDSAAPRTGKTLAPAGEPGSALALETAIFVETPANEG
ncbi:MAG: Aldose 1-epimerase [candidate division BRC1 bacterium ADurb.BinA364]|nr:MAG: Aldose 1-epimerase [candidate division BRC1 bacterium ADurb.BinA364]